MRIMILFATLLSDFVMASNENCTDVQRILSVPKSFHLSKNSSRPKLWKKAPFSGLGDKISGAYERAKHWANEKAKARKVKTTKKKMMNWDWDRQRVPDIPHFQDGNPSEESAEGSFDQLEKPEWHSRKVKRFFTNSDNPEVNEEVFETTDNTRLGADDIKKYIGVILKRFEKVRKARNNGSVNEDLEENRSVNSSTLPSRNMTTLSRNAALSVLKELAKEIGMDESSIDSISLVLRFPTQDILENINSQTVISAKNSLKRATNIKSEYATRSTISISDVITNSNNFQQKTRRTDVESLNITESLYPKVINEIKTMMSRANSFYCEMASNVDKLYNEFLQVNGFNNN